MNIIAALVIAALGGGCASYQPKPISLAQTASAFDSRSLTNADALKFISSHLTNQPASIETWSIDALTLAAFYYHPSLQLARAQMQTAEAGKLTAAARPNPTISFSPGYDFSAAGGANPWIPGTTLEVPIETAGKRGKRILQARELAIAAELATVTTAWQIRSNVRSAAIDVWATSAREATVASAITHQSNLVRLLKQRVAAGAIAPNDALPIQGALVRLQAELAATRTATLQARARLADAIGIPIANLPALKFQQEFFQIDPAVLENASTLRANALQHRADILAALARYEAAQAALRLEIAKQYPDVRLGSGYQWDQGDHKWNVLISLELPLLNQNQGPIAEAEARRNERAIEVMEIQARAVNDIDRALSTVEAARQELVRAREGLAALQRQSQAASERLAAGAADQVELETAAVEENAAAIVAFEAQARVLAAEAELEAALQVTSSVLLGANVFGLASQ